LFSSPTRGCAHARRRRDKGGKEVSGHDAATRRAVLSRRRFASLSATAALVGQGGASRAQSVKPLTIGILNDASGPTADLSGVGSQISAEMAVEDFGGSVLGRPIVLLKADHQAKPDLGMGFARQWYDQGVGAIFDIGITTVAIGVQQLARDKDKIAVFTSTGTVDLTRSLCSPNGIHWTYDSHSVAVGAARANMKGGAKTWFFMTADYVYGRSLQAEATEFIEAHGGTVVGSARHAFATKDFSSDILKAESSGAALIGLATPTPQIANIVKQAAEFGIGRGGQTLAPIGLFFNDVKAIGLPLAQGLLTTEPFYWDQDDATRAFSKRFFERFHAMPNSLQASVHGAVTHYLNAVKAANSDDTGTVLKVMKATPINDFMTHGGLIRPDGRVVRDLYVFRVKSPGASKGDWDLYEQISTIPGDQAFAPPDPATCNLVK
jgi:branched-chain amino acid transport system substrate-binding protein